MQKLVPLELERENRRFLMVCSQFFRNLGEKGKPQVIILDDLQWADEGTLALLREICDDIQDCPLLILCCYRDNEVTEEHSLRKIMRELDEREFDYKRIMLDNFTFPILDLFLDELLMKKGEPLSELTEYVFKKGKGNPFFSI